MSHFVSKALRKPLWEGMHGDQLVWQVCPTQLANLTNQHISTRQPHTRSVIPAAGAQLPGLTHMQPDQPA